MKTSTKLIVALLSLLISSQVFAAKTKRYRYIKKMHQLKIGINADFLDDTHLNLGYAFNAGYFELGVKTKTMLNKFAPDYNQTYFDLFTEFNFKKNRGYKKFVPYIGILGSVNLSKDMMAGGYLGIKWFLGKRTAIVWDLYKILFQFRENNLHHKSEVALAYYFM